MVLGGSIMAGGDIYHPRRNTDSFVGQVFTWIETTFPNKAHKLRNACLPATGSTYISICMHEHVKHEDVDLVILEFDINDSTPTGACRYLRLTKLLLANSNLQHANADVVLAKDLPSSKLSVHAVYCQPFIVRKRKTNLMDIGVTACNGQTEAQMLFKAQAQKLICLPA